MNNKTLTALFAAVGRRYGYEETTAEFAAFRDFKIKWTRSPRWISFEVSDYLSDAPERVMTSMAVTIFDRIKGEEAKAYDDEVSEWITSDEFVRSKQPLFVRRFRGLSRGTAGESRDLADSYERLIDCGLVERDPDIYIGWAGANRSLRVARSSVLMKVVAMSDLLDDDGVPEDVLDYCLYTQLAHIGMGFNPFSDRRGPEYDALLSRFPGRPSMESYLRGKGMYV